MKPETKLPLYLPYPVFLLKTNLSQTARVLYALLLHRATLSQKNHWVDEQNRLYVIYPISDLAAFLGKSTTTIKAAMNELRNADLLVSRKQGFCRANRLFLKHYTDDPPNEPAKRYNFLTGSPGDEEMTIKESENRPSVGRKADPLTAGKPSPSKRIEKTNTSKPLSEYDYSYEEGESF